MLQDAAKSQEIKRLVLIPLPLDKGFKAVHLLFQLKSKKVCFKWCSLGGSGW